MWLITVLFLLDQMVVGVVEQTGSRLKPQSLKELLAFRLIGLIGLTMGGFMTHHNMVLMVFILC
jgi:hypothetical protein